MTKSLPFEYTPRTMVLACSLLTVITLLAGAMYLVLQARGLYLPQSLYWIAVVGAFIVIIVQILVLPVNLPRSELRILVQTIAFGLLVLSAINASTPYGIPLYDTHFDLGATNQILESGWPLPIATTQSTIRLVSDWPLIQFLAIDSFFVAGLSLDVSALILPQVLYTIGFTAIYIMCRRFYPTQKRAALAVVLVSLATLSIAPDPVFARSAAGFAFMFLSVALVAFRSEGASNRSVAIAICQALFIVALTLSHSLSALLLVIFCGFWYLTPRLSNAASRLFRTRARTTQEKVPGADSSLNALLISTVLFIAYVVWVGTDFFSFAVPTIFNASTSGLSVQSSLVATSIRTQLVLLANAVIASVLVFMTVRHIRTHEACPHWYLDSMLLGFGLFMAGLTVLMSRFPGLHGLTIPTYRGLGFAWPFIYMAGLHSSLGERPRPCMSGRPQLRRQDRESPRRRRVLERGAAVALALALVMVPVASLLQLSPSVIDHSVLPDYSTGAVRPYFLEGELAFAQNFKLSGKVIGDQGVYTLLALYQNHFVYTELGVLSGNESAVGAGQWIVYRSENEYGLFAPYQQASALTKVNWTRIDGSSDLSLVYNDGDVVTYAITPS